MKYVLLVVIIGLLGYLYYNSRNVMDQVTGGVKLIGSSVDADNLEGKPVKPYAIPKGHCKAYFPGDPRIPGVGQELINSFQNPGNNVMMGDKEMNYYLSEVAMPAMDLANLRFSDNPVQSNFTSVNLNGAQGGSSYSSIGNNEATRVNSFQSDAIRAQTALDNFVDDWAKGKNATVESKMAACLNGGQFCGREILGHLKNPEDRFHIKLFCDPKNKVIVIVGVVAHQKRMNKSSTNKFLSSVEMWQ
jgi:hypothetical protein